MHINSPANSSLQYLASSEQPGTENICAAIARGSVEELRRLLQSPEGKKAVNAEYAVNVDLVRRAIAAGGSAAQMVQALLAAMEPQTAETVLLQARPALPLRPLLAQALATRSHELMQVLFNALAPDRQGALLCAVLQDWSSDAGFVQEMLAARQPAELATWLQTRDDWESNPLYYAVARERDADILLPALEALAEDDLVAVLKATDRRGGTVLHWVAGWHHHMSRTNEGSYCARLICRNSSTHWSS